MRKTALVWLMLILILNSLLTVEFSLSQTVKPVIPEFTVRYVDYSYDTPVSTPIDPFTGKVTTKPTQHIENKTIQITIKNQTINDSDYLYYKVRMKGYASEQWANISFIQANPNSEFTNLQYSSTGGSQFYFAGESVYIPSGGKLDFQVQAQVWTYIQSDSVFGSWNQVLLAESDWSSTQTIHLDEESSAPTSASQSTVSATPNPSASHLQSPGATPNQPVWGNSVFLGLDWVGVVVLMLLVVAVVLLVLVVVFLHKRAPR